MTMPEHILVILADGTVRYMIPVKAHGSEGCIPRQRASCPYLQEHGVRTSCVSGSGGSCCGGFMGGTPGYVFCIWGLY